MKCGLALLFCRELNAATGIQGYCKALRHLQLYIALLNVVHNHLIFTLKVSCLGMSICGGYAAVAHFSDYPLFGIVYYVVLLETCIFYAVPFQKAFKVPTLVAQARAACRVRAQSLTFKNQHDAIKRQLRSIPFVGIKVGEFHTLERTSTPAFLHYVLTNIVNMLVTFN